jgi:hypothetical protein
VRDGGGSGGRNAERERYANCKASSHVANSCSKAGSTQVLVARGGYPEASAPRGLLRLLLPREAPCTSPRIAAKTAGWAVFSTTETRTPAASLTFCASTGSTA